MKSLNACISTEDSRLRLDRDIRLFNDINWRLKAAHVETEQRVDSFGLGTDKARLEALSQLDFPRTLRQLEVYGGMTGWLRKHFYYANIKGTRTTSTARE